MSLPLPLHRLWLHALRLGAGLISVTAILPAQEALYVKHGSGLALVVAASEGTPLVLDHGKLIDAETHLYVLKKVPEYEPVFVSVSHLQVTQTYVDGSAGDRDHHFLFNGEFTSPYLLEHVFLVLDLSVDKAGRLLFVREVGTIGPHKSRSITLDAPLIGGLGEGKYTMHVFSEGREVLNSMMPWEFREHVLDQMVGERTSGAPDRPPQPFVGPAPDYPPALRAAKVSGRAVVRIKIGVRGNAMDPTLVSATDPAFGEAALAAIRQWRFLPKIVAGVPAPVTAEFPFAFSP